MPTIRVSDRRGRVSPTALKTVREHAGATRRAHAPDRPAPHRAPRRSCRTTSAAARSTSSAVSGRIRRRSTRRTRTTTSGTRVDFRVDGVPNEVVRDFCRTLKNVGVRLLPEQHVFVHMDVRTTLGLLDRLLEAGRAAAATTRRTPTPTKARATSPTKCMRRRRTLAATQTHDPAGRRRVRSRITTPSATSANSAAARAAGSHVDTRQHPEQYADSAAHVRGRPDPT